MKIVFIQKETVNILFGIKGQFFNAIIKYLETHLD